MYAPAEAPLDRINCRLIEELQADARVSLAELGRRVGLSAPAVAERIARLEEARVITGYHAEVDPRALGFTLGAIIRIRPAPRQIPTVAKLAQRHAAGAPSATASPATTASSCASWCATSRSLRS